MFLTQSGLVNDAVIVSFVVAQVMIDVEYELKN